MQLEIGGNLFTVVPVNFTGWNDIMSRNKDYEATIQNIAINDIPNPEFKTRIWKNGTHNSKTIRVTGKVGNGNGVGIVFRY